MNTHTHTYNTFILNTFLKYNFQEAKIILLILVVDTR